jgi:hypothetical protein
MGGPLLGHIESSGSVELSMVADVSGDEASHWHCQSNDSARADRPMADSGEPELPLYEDGTP